MQTAILFIAASLLVTEKADTLSQASITADKGLVVSMTDTVSVYENDSFSELMMRLPGLTLSDYGSEAGLKTVSMRGLGSAHTAIYVDGVRVSNLQSGQGDIGFLDLDSFSKAVVDYAQNSVSFTSERPFFKKGQRFSGKAEMRLGSWDTYMPELKLNYSFNRDVVASVYSSATLSEGDFTFPDMDGKSLVRQNNDIRQYRIGADVFGLADKGNWKVKAYYNRSRRGVPGSLYFPSQDRQNDENAFIQTVSDTRYSRLFSMKSSAKLALDNQHYINELQSAGYSHREIQLNNAYIFDIKDWWTVSLGSDLIWNGLKSNNYEGAASRISVLNNLASSFRFENFRADLNIEQNRFHDKGQEALNVIAPAVNLRYRAVEGLDVLAYSRRSFRAPTYNELYYVGFGNKDLKPEDAWISDIGIDYHGRIGCVALAAKLDAYYATTSNKIISAPDPSDPSGFIWKPYNVGKAETKGVDALVDVQLGRGMIRGNVRTRYSFVDAKDMTDGSALPYIAKHSLGISGELNVGVMRFLLDYNLRAGRRDADGSMGDFDTVDFSMDIPLVIARSYSADVLMKVRNLFDSHYEMIGGYPMPGASFVGGLEIRF